MSLKVKKNIPLIDQHDKNFMYGGKFGGNFIPETLKKPIDDLTQLFQRLRNDNKFLASNGRFGIPFDIIFSPQLETPIILPEILTTEKLLSSIKKASLSQTKL